MKTGDSRAKGGPGFLPLQGHNKRWKVDQRPAVLAYRLTDRKDAFGELGQWVYDEETAGDLNLGFLWEIPAPNSDVATVDPKNKAKAGKREIPGWAFAWPVVTEIGQGGNGAAKPYKIGLDVDLLFPGTKGNATASGVTTGTAGRCGSAPNKIIGYPVGDYKFNPDKRYVSKNFKGIPLGKDGKSGAWPKFPSGWVGIGLTTTEEYQQTELFFPTDPRLVAVNVAGDPVMGSLVCDLTPKWDVDSTRMARLQSAFRVVKRPKSWIWGASPMTQNMFAEDGGGVPLNSLALQLRPAGCDGVGWGMFADSVEVRVYPGVGNYDDVANVEKCIIGLGSYNERGPFCVGELRDKHRIGADADGNPINSLHINTAAYFIDMQYTWSTLARDANEKPEELGTETRDGPLFFEGQYEGGDTYTYRSLVHLGWESEPKHPFVLGRERKGYWKWWAEVPLTTVSSSSYYSSSSTSPVKPVTIVASSSSSSKRPAAIPDPRASSGSRRPGIASVDDRDVRFLPEAWKSNPALQSVATGPNSSTNANTKKPFLGTHMQMGTPGLCAWPQNYAPNLPNYATNANIGQAAAEKIKSSTPITGQIDAYGAQGGLVDAIPYGADSYVGASGDPWVYTQYPGATSRFAGGTANGGFVLLPPQVSLSDEGTGLRPLGITLSTTYFIAAPNTYWGAGLPELADGSMRVGYSWGVDDTTGDLVYRSHGSAPDNAVRFTNTAQNIGWRSGTDFWGTLDHVATADRTWTFPDVDGTLVLGGGSGALNRVAYWSDADTLTSNANLTFDGTTLNLTGPLQISSTTLFEADRDLAVSLIPNADNALDIGSAARRFTSITSRVFDMRDGVSDANAALLLGDDGSGNLGLYLGAGGATALDIRIFRGAANRLDLASGDSLNLVSGSVTANSLNLKDSTLQIVLDSDAAVNTGTITMAALTAARTWTFPDATGTIPFGTGTANQVTYWSGTNALTSDADLTFDGTILTVASQLRVGTATDTATAGDFVAGLTGAARMFYDQSASELTLYTSAGAAEVILNEVGATSFPLRHVFGESQGVGRYVSLGKTFSSDPGETSVMLDARMNVTGALTNRFLTGLSGVLSLSTGSGGATITGAAANTYKGLSGDLLVSGTLGTVEGNAYSGFHCGITLNGSPAITGLLAACRITYTNAAPGYTGTLTDLAGVNIENPSDSWTITNAYGIRILTQLRTGTTNGWSIRALGVSDLAEFEGYMRVGSANDAAATGDFSCGNASVARIFFDQSAATTAFYNASNAIVNLISAVATTPTVFNEIGGAQDLRVEGDTLAYMLFLNGSDAALENIAFLTTAEPGWNTMDGGMFIGNVSTAPTGNPTAGGYLYVVAGALTWRGSGGTVTTMGPAEPHCPKCGHDYIHEWENKSYKQSYLAVCMKCLTDEIGERPWIMRKKRVA